MPDLRNLPPLSKAERALVRPPDRASQTLLAKMDVCHRAAALHLKYGGEDRDENGERTLGTWQSHALTRGALLHECFRRCKRALIDSDETSMHGELSKEIMEEVLAEHPELPLPEYEQDACRIMAYNWGEATVIDPDTIVAIEDEFVWELTNGTVSGKPDFAEIVDGRVLRIKDYKTSLAMPSLDELENGRKSFQLKLYSAMMLFGRTAGGVHYGAGIQTAEASQQFPRYRDEMTGDLYGRTVVFDRHYLDNDFRHTIERLLASLRVAHETGRWQAVQGSHCNECPAPSECPIPAHLRDLPEITTYEDAQEAGEKVISLERELKRLRKGMRGFTDEDGRTIYVGADFAFDFNVQTNSAGVTSTPFRKRKVTAEEREASDATG